jgi:hypothetical protein
MTTRGRPRLYHDETRAPCFTARRRSPVVRCKRAGLRDRAEATSPVSSTEADLQGPGLAAGVGAAGAAGAGAATGGAAGFGGVDAAAPPPGAWWTLGADVAGGVALGGGVGTGPPTGAAAGPLNGAAAGPLGCGAFGGGRCGGLGVPSRGEPARRRARVTGAVLAASSSSEIRMSAEPESSRA